MVAVGVDPRRFGGRGGEFDHAGGPGPKNAVVPVVVAVVHPRCGGSITPEAVEIKEFPGVSFRPTPCPGWRTRSIADIFVPLTKDEPVLEGKLAPKGAGRGLAALIPRGMRAYSVKVPDVAQGVAGFILPGNRVDVLLSIGDIGGSNETGGGSTTTLLQNVEILAVDQKMDAPADNKVDTKDLRSVTLLVNPQAGDPADLGQNKGMLHLALRNLEDDKAAQTKPATLIDLRSRRRSPGMSGPKGCWNRWARPSLGGRRCRRRRPRPRSRLPRSRSARYEESARVPS